MAAPASAITGLSRPTPFPRMGNRPRRNSPCRRWRRSFLRYWNNDATPEQRGATRQSRNGYIRRRITVQQEELFFCILRQPRMFGSKLDKDAYFRWIQEIRGVISIEGLPSSDSTTGGAAGLRVGINMDQFDDWSLRELLALYYRYDLDFEELTIFVNENNRQWVCDPNKFWANRLLVSSRESPRPIKL